MALPRVPPQLAFEIDLSPVGRVKARRAIVRDLAELSKLDRTAVSTPETVRALLRMVGSREGAGELQADEIAKIGDEDLERFAEQMVQAYSETRLPREEGESAVRYLNRMVTNWTAHLDGPISSLSRMFNQSGIERMRDMFPLASRLAQASGAPANTGTRATHVITTPIPDRIPNIPVPRPADSALEKMEERLKAFEAALNENETAELLSVSAPGGPSFYIEECQAISSEMISLRGFDTQGKPVEIVQHYSQFNIAFFAVPDQPQGYGFLGPAETPEAS